MNTIKAVIFDLDNTLLDRTSTFRNFTNCLISDYFEHIGTTHHIADRIIYLDQDGYKDKEELFLELLEELPWKKRPFLSELLEFYSIEYVRNAVLMENAIEVIQYVREKYKIGLITNGKTRIQYGKIDQLGIRDEFNLIIVSEEAGIKKSDAKIFEMAINKLELKPEQCLYIGDHPINDIVGAADVGMRTIWMKVNQPWPTEVTAKPFHQIDRLNALFDLI